MNRLLRPRSSELLAERLERDLDWPIEKRGLRFRRLYPGHWQRSAGAWLWMFEATRAADVAHEIGSCFTVRECLKAEKLELFESCGCVEVIPLNPKPESE